MPSLPSAKTWSENLDLTPWPVHFTIVLAAVTDYVHPRCSRSSTPLKRKATFP
jgi:hypothetical protein